METKNHFSFNSTAVTGWTITDSVKNYLNSESYYKCYLHITLADKSKEWADIVEVKSMSYDVNSIVGWELKRILYENLERELFYDAMIILDEIVPEEEETPED